MIPKTAVVAVLVPAPGKAVVGLRRELSVISRALPGMWPLLDALVERDTAHLGADLLDPAGLASIGVDVTAPLAFVPQRSGAAALVTVTLSDQARFSRWLAARDPSAQRTKIGGELVSIAFAESDTPVACAVRQHLALCQIGDEAGDDPLAALRGLMLGSGTPLSRVPSVRAAARGLAPGAHAYLVAIAEPLASMAEAYVVSQSRASHRFDPPLARRRAHQRAVDYGAKVRRVLRVVRGAAAAIQLDDDGPKARIHLAMASSAGERLVGLVTDTSGERNTSRLAGWARTPALARLVLRLQPGLLQEILQHVGLDLPVDALDGTFAALALGLDTEAPAAKAGAPSTPEILPCLVPSAALVGLARPLTPAHFGGHRPTIARAILGSPVELRLEDSTLFVGTGPGAGAAATRRWHSADPAPDRTSGFLELSIDPPAISAAIEGGVFGTETRDELRLVSRLHRRLRPLLHHYARLEVLGAAEPANNRVTFDVSVRR